MALKPTGSFRRILPAGVMATQESRSGAAFEPWQRNLYQQAGSAALGALKPLTDDGFDFETALKTVGGPNAEFTDINNPLTPAALKAMENTVFGDAAARTAAQQERIREGAPPGTSGFGLTERLAAAQRFNDAAAQRAATQLRGEYAPKISLQAQGLQTNVESERAQDDRLRRQLALLSQRDRTGQISALLAALGQFGQPLPFSESVAYGPELPFVKGKGAFRPR